MSIVEELKSRHRITNTPIVHCVNDHNYADENVISSEQIILDRPDNSCSVSIKIRPQWSVVASHPIFQLEYKDYIRNY